MSVSWSDILQAFDASAIIHGWDHYPIDQFPRLWEWLGERLAAGDPVICAVALEEVDRRAPDCHQWLLSQTITRVEMTNADAVRAAAIEQALGIVNQRYNQAGVGENDLLIIASALESGHELITNEGRQSDLPKKKARYKIPAVCAMSSVSVPCLSFLDFIRSSGVVFDSGAK